MTGTTERPTDRAWTQIEQEQRRDRFVRRVSIAAWTSTLVVVLALVGATAYQASMMSTLMGGMGRMAILAMVQQGLIVLGALSVLIATLATIGTFLRLRTASLQEIQLRLASLEEMLQASAQTSAAGPPER